MTDDRAICERLEDQSIDGAIYLRINAAKEIRALRHYVARLEEDLAIADNETERLRKYSSKQALDIVTLGQEVGRLREALEASKKKFEVLLSTHDRLRNKPIEIYGSAALAEKEKRR